MDDANAILSTAQRLLSLLSKIYPPPATRTSVKKPLVLHHHDLNLNNILDNADGDITAVIDWECVSALPLWMLSQVPKFLDEKKRDDEPQRDMYMDTADRDQPVHDDDVDNEV